MFKLKRVPTHPGAILNEEFLKPLDISQTQIAKDLNTTFRTINELVNGKRNLSPLMAIKLAKYFGTTSNLWLNLQNEYDIYKISKKKEKEIKKITVCMNLKSKKAA